MPVERGSAITQTQELSELLHFKHLPCSRGFHGETFTPSASL
jgi:hypothetical protein